MNIMGVFHPENNIGLEVFFIGTVAMFIFMVCFVIWCFYSDRKWKEKMKNERKL